MALIPLLILSAQTGLLGGVAVTKESVEPEIGESQVRVVVPFNIIGTFDARTIMRECGLIHELNDALALACPVGIARDLVEKRVAIEDRLYQLFDLESDRYISADDSWTLGLRGAGVKVAVLDTGVDMTHPELSDSVILAANFVRGPNRPQDEDGHGTHVIGIVTANGGRTITGGSQFNVADPNEATGASPKAFVLSGRVCGRNGCFGSDIEAGIDWAVQQGARVINLSLGGGNFGSHCDGDRLAAKANWAVDQGVVVVAAAGNDALGVSSPACGSKVIAVGAVYQRNIGLQDYSPTCVDQTTSPDQIVCFSNRGSALDLVAPGAGILSTFSCIAAGDCNRSWYAWGWGTSQASPHVAAVAALLLSMNSSLTPAEVKNILEVTARDVGTIGRDSTFGAGIVDAFAAISELGLKKLFELDWSDYDNDGTATIFDIASSASAYNQANSYWDLNLSNQVDIFDIATVSSYYTQQFSDLESYPGKGLASGTLDPVWTNACGSLPEPDRSYCMTRI